MSETTEGQTPETPESDPDPKNSGESEIDWEAEAKKWKQLSRKNENAFRDSGGKIKELTEEMEKLRSELNTQRVTDTQALALATLDVHLARAGVGPEDSKQLVGFLDPSRLVTDRGEPDPEAIEAAATALAKSRAVAAPDTDQGKSDKDKPERHTPNNLIRAMVR